MALSSQLGKNQLGQFLLGSYQVTDTMQPSLNVIELRTPSILAVIHETPQLNVVEDQ